MTTIPVASVLDTRRVTAVVVDAEPCSTTKSVGCEPRKPIVPTRINVEYAIDTGRHTSITIVGHSASNPRLVVVTHEVTHSPDVPDWVREFVDGHRPDPSHRCDRRCRHRMIHIPLQPDSDECRHCGPRWTSTTSCPERCVLPADYWKA